MTTRKFLYLCFFLLVGVVLSLGSCSKAELPDGSLPDTLQVYKLPPGFKFPAQYNVRIDYYGAQAMEKGISRMIGSEEQKKYFPYMPFINDFWGFTQGIKDLSPRENKEYYSYNYPIRFVNHHYLTFFTDQQIAEPIQYRIRNDSLSFIENSQLGVYPFLIAFGNFNGFYEYDNFIKCDDLYFTLPKTQHPLSPKEVEEIILLNPDIFMRYLPYGKPKSIAVASYKKSYVKESKLLPLN